MSEDTDWIAHAEAMKTPELIRWTAGWRQGSAQHIAGQFVLAQRAGRKSEIRGWIAIALAAVLLVLSVCVALFK